MHYRRARGLVVEPEPALPLTVDGEVVPETARFSAEVLPAALPVLAGVSDGVGDAPRRAS